MLVNANGSGQYDPRPENDRPEQHEPNDAPQYRTIARQRKKPVSASAQRGPLLRSTAGGPAAANADACAVTMDDASENRLIAGLKQQLATPNTTTWSKSGVYIKGAVQYDADHDRGPLDEIEQKVQHAEKNFADAEHQMTSRTDPFSGLPWPDDYKKYEGAKQQLADARAAYEEAKKKRDDTLRQSTDRALPYEAGQLALDAQNHLKLNAKAGEADWILSATDTREVLATAAQNVKDHIDAQLGKCWEQLVLDLREWRGENLGKIDAEDIDRRINKVSETYLLLAQHAEIRKNSVDAQLNSFNAALDGNQAKIAEQMKAPGDGGKSAVVDLLRERKANLQSAIDDINDQSGLAASLMATTVNNARVATARTEATPFVSTRKYQGSPHDYAGKMSIYDTRSGKDVLVGTLDCGVTTIKPAEKALAGLPAPDTLVSPGLTIPNTHLKVVFEYDRQAAAAYPGEHRIAFIAHPGAAQPQAAKDFTRYGGAVSAMVRAGEYGYVRFNNARFVKDKLPVLATYQKPMMPFHQPIPAVAQFATRGVSVASDFTRMASYLQSASAKVARGEDPTSDYVAAGAAAAQGTINSSLGFYVDAALVGASQYKANHPQSGLPGKPQRPVFAEATREPARGISYEYRPDGTLSTAQRIDVDTGALQSYLPAADEFDMRNMPESVTPSVARASPAQVADVEIQAQIDETARSIEQSSASVAQAHEALRTNGMPRIDKTRARVNALAAETRERFAELKNGFQKFSFNTELNRANQLGGEKWSIPAGVKLMAYGSAMLALPAFVEFGARLPDFIRKSEQGSATESDNEAMAASVTGLLATITPYIPVVGPVVTPFLLFANILLNALSGNNKTPVENVAAQLRSQTAHALTYLSS